MKHLQELYTAGNLSFEQIPPLDRDMFGLLLRSLVQARQAESDPLCMMKALDDTFYRRTWKQQGMADSFVHSVCNDFKKLLGLRELQVTVDDAPRVLLQCAWSAWCDGVRSITFSTSGSTGVPKPCIHSELALRQECRFLAALFGKHDSILATVPLHHAFGFAFGLYLSRGIGVPLRMTVPLPQLLREAMRVGDIVLSIPYFWTRFVQGERVNGHGITLVSATAPLPSSVMRTLLGWGFRCIDIFGSSETGALCWREAPDVPFTLFPQFVFPQYDENIKHICRSMPFGEDIMLPLMDKIVRVNARQILPTGRVDAAVQVAGHNVYPARVAEILSEVEGVAECTVRLMPPEKGERLRAFIVPVRGEDPQRLLPALKKHAHIQLTGPERPVQYTFGHSLPRNVMGKLTDW